MRTIAWHSGRCVLMLVTAFLVVFADKAMAEERLALVIGNASYTDVSSLKNPMSDAMLIASSLESVGFQVTLMTDADQIAMSRAVAEFGRALREAGRDATGLFYFAGHGVQSFGRNYLLPVDTQLSDPADLDFVALEAQSVLRQMFSARNRTNIVILDACRNNPFQNIPEFGDNGLAEMRAPSGTFLAYATAPNDVALDGEGDNSPFSAALAREMAVPGRTIEDVFREVRIDVFDKTSGAQTPWDTSSITVEFSFVEKPLVDPEVAAAQRLWDSVKNTNDPVQVMLFLRGYPSSPFAEEARAMLSEMLAGELKTPQPEPSPTPEVSVAEQELITKAQTSGELADYEAYLARFPDGVFAEFARSEIATEAAKDPIASADVDIAAVAPADTFEQETIAMPDGDIGFETPLVSQLPEVHGRSIAELINGSPLYAPIEGLPEALWKDQTCSSCHNWTPDDLCTQAQVYLNSAQRSLLKTHPYGGEFKGALGKWAANGCP